MITLRPSKHRGRTAIGWLDSFHSFSFGEYYDPENMGFRALRVINDDRIAPGMGFGTHGHQDMEIVTYVLSGALQHRDSLGNGDVLRPGDVQRMSAGTGIRHSEFNPSANEPVHLLQIWIEPDRTGQPPSYAQQHFPIDQRRDRWCLVADGQGRNGALCLGADAAVSATVLTAGATLACPLAAARHLWLQVARGTISVGNQRLNGGDALAISDESAITITAESESELLAFDLA